jgi:hypothetical protein
VVPPSEKSSAFYRKLSGGSVPRVSSIRSSLPCQDWIDAAAKLSISEI